MAKEKQAPSPLLFTEEFWRQSQLSLAKVYGRVNYNGNLFVVVDKRGRTLLECTYEAEKLGKKHAIDPGEPADLIWNDLIPHYKKLGRDRILEIIKSGGSYQDIVIESKSKKRSKK